MTTNFADLASKILQRLLLGMLLTCLAASAVAQARRPLIYIDPGHGGRDRGAIGAAGMTEKDIVLTTARELQACLQAETWNTGLTRNDDYLLSLYDRTALANQAKADLFVSLHTGASYVRQTGGIILYYLQDPDAMAPERLDQFSPYTTNGPRPWSEVQLRHQNKSMRLAQDVLSGIQQRLPALDCRVVPAPLVVLQGADMPAILIEIGYLTNPTEERILSDPVSRQRLVNGMCEGIKAYIEKR
jgi:N-acetylmuramoyl-L-alanine amidase